MIVSVFASHASFHRAAEYGIHPESLLDQLDEADGALGHAHAGGLECRRFSAAAPLGRMIAPAWPSGWRGHAGNETDDRLLHLVLRTRASCSSVPPISRHHADTFVAGSFEGGEAVDEVRAVDQSPPIPTSSCRGRRSELIDDFVGEGARATTTPTSPACKSAQG
jgi:hypothetical protein